MLLYLATVVLGILNGFIFIAGIFAGEFKILNLLAALLCGTIVYMSERVY